MLKTDCTPCYSQLSLTSESVVGVTHCNFAFHFGTESSTGLLKYEEITYKWKLLWKLKVAEKII